jgi:hypothetical protein
MAEATAGALQIVQTQQNLVGNTIAGGASAVNEKSSDSQIGILEQIREITLQSFRKTSEIASTLANTLLFQKDESRRREDQSSELELEKNKSNVSKKDSVGGDGAKKAEEAAGRFDGTMFALGALLPKILSPFKGLLNFFTKLKPLVGIFTKLGPLASGLLRLSGIGTILFLLIKYSDEIIKALTPALESISKAFESLKPAIDFIFSLIDGGIKVAINAIGGAISGIALAIEVVAETFSGVLDGIKQLAEGNIIKGLLTILKSIVMAPINLLKGLGKIIGDFFIGLIDALPLPKFIKDKFKGAVEKKETKTGGAGDTSGEAASPENIGEVIDPSVETASNITPEEKPKTINMDKPQSVVSTVATMRETGGETKKEASVENLVERRNKLLMQGPSGTSDTAQRAFEGELKMRNAAIIEAKGRPEEHIQKNIIDPSLYAQLDMQNKLSDLFPDFYEQPTFKFGTVPSETGTVAENQELMSPDDQMNQFDKSIPKRNLKEDSRGESSMSVVNAPVNSSSVVNNSQPTISYVKMNTGVDAYTEKMQNSF